MNCCHYSVVHVHTVPMPLSVFTMSHYTSPNSLHYDGVCTLLCSHHPTDSIAHIILLSPMVCLQSPCACTFLLMVMFTLSCSLSCFVHYHTGTGVHSLVHKPSILLCSHHLMSVLTLSWWSHYASVVHAFFPTSLCNLVWTVVMTSLHTEQKKMASSCHGFRLCCCWWKRQGEGGGRAFPFYWQNSANLKHESNSWWKHHPSKVNNTDDFNAGDGFFCACEDLGGKVQQIIPMCIFSHSFFS